MEEFKLVIVFYEPVGLAFAPLAEPEGPLLAALPPATLPAPLPRGVRPDRAARQA